MSQASFRAISMEELGALDSGIATFFRYVYQILIFDKRTTTKLAFEETYLQDERTTHLKPISDDHYLEKVESFMIHVPKGYKTLHTLQYVATELQRSFDCLLPGVVTVHFNNKQFSEKNTFLFEVNAEARPWSFARQQLAIEQIVDKIVDFLPKSIVQYRRAKSFEFSIWCSRKAESGYLQTNKMLTTFKLKLRKKANVATIQTTINDLPDLVRLIEYKLRQTDTSIPFGLLTITSTPFHTIVESTMGIVITVSEKT
ncbi:hypothetical protein HN958_04405 [Candidatus Falkowbacteria bacterium]|jgi:hypothetical protein|nr:hypothetical protein [Candidatus Falkowbacteria bacterium]MBT7007718.1 hypothetical protein [Candidatus Falkowbacteria bacterium]